MIAASPRISPVALATSALMHAALAVCLLAALPGTPPRERPQPIEIFVDVAAARPANASPTSRNMAMELPAPPPLAAEAPADLAPPPPDPAAPEIATRMTTPLTPPGPTGPPAQQAATARMVPPPQPALERMLPSVEAPPAPSARDIVGSAPRTTAPPPAVTKQAARPQAPVPKARMPRAPSTSASHAARLPAASTESDGNRRQAREDYLWQIMRKLSQYKVRPAVRETSEQGLVVMRLTLARDGRLIGLALARSSGFPDLDRGVMETTRAASPFAPPPSALAHDPVTLVVPIRYVHDR